LAVSVQRRAIHIPGIAHGPGRPAGSQIGNTIVSATLSGRNADGVMSPDPSEQMRELFLTMVRFLEAAGASVDNVIRVNITVAKGEYRELMNVEWAKYFNDEESLPTRIATVAPLRGELIAELDLMAVTG
jgi:2-iminobutanoate/2-iminopropanoate deaminase